MATAKTPLYQRVKAQLRRAIEEGRYLPGERLPTEDELQASFGVSRNTVTHAVHELVNEGLLYRVRGSGTYVRRGAPAGMAGAASMAAKVRERAAAGSGGSKGAEYDAAELPVHFGIVADVGVPLGNPYVTGILEGLTRCLTAVNGRAVFSGPWGEKLDHLESFGLKWASEVDGLLIIAPHRSRLESLRVLERQHVPFVVAGARLATFEGRGSVEYPWHNVYVDNRAAMSKAVEYLQDLGHRRIAAFTGGWESLDSADRAIGFVAACERGGEGSRSGSRSEGRSGSTSGSMSGRPSASTGASTGASASGSRRWWCATPETVARLMDESGGEPAALGGSSAAEEWPEPLLEAEAAGVYWLAELADELAWYKSVPEQVERWMALPAGRRPTAIVAGGFSLALATLRSLRQLGFAVPGQVSVIGFDDSVSAAYLDPPLTTVVQPLAEMGEVAGRALAAAIRHQLIGRINRPLAAELRIRESAGPPPADARVVSRVPAEGRANS